MRTTDTLDILLETAADDERLRTAHISLFAAMFHLSAQQQPDGSFRVSRKILMRFTRIRSIATYHLRLKELVDYGYIIYRPSYDPYKGSRVCLITNEKEMN